MLFPYSTDAPIYHWPFATVGLIAINTVVFFAVVGMAPDMATVEVVQPYILEYGKGLQPHQWLTANFLHADLIHLVGNMLALWGFGLIVEGKIGWWRFLAIYLGMGVGQCMLEQMFVPASLAIGSLGASGVIFGLMAMSLVWAPMNEVSCILLIWFRPFLFDLTILTYTMIMGALQLLFFTLTATTAGVFYGSEALHLIGAVFGLAVGLAMLKLNWVDCENWDAFSVLAGRHRMSLEKMAELRQQYPASPVDEQRHREETERQRRSALKQIEQILVDGRHELAYAAHVKMARSIDHWRLPEAPVSQNDRRLSSDRTGGRVGAVDGRVSADLHGASCVGAVEVGRDSPPARAATGAGTARAGQDSAGGVGRLADGLSASTGAAGRSPAARGRARVEPQDW